MKNIIKKIGGLCLGLAMLSGVAVGINSTVVEQVVAEKTTQVSNGNFYIGATTGGNDFYLFVPDATSASVAGSAVSSKSNATVFTFTGSGTSWTIQFSNGNYLTLKNGKDNGKVIVQTDSATWTSSIEGGKLRLSANATYSLQKNNGGAQFGSYANTQTDIWLEQAGSSKTLTALTVSGEPSKTSYNAGQTLDPTGLVVTGTYDDASEETITSGIEWTFDPEEFSLGDTSCDVVASVGDVDSDAYTVSGITVAEASSYKLVNSTDDLVVGAHYIIGNSSSTSGFFMSTEANSNNRKRTSSFEISDDGSVALDNTMLVLELGGETGAWTFLTTNYLGTNGYLASASSGSDNHCRVIASKETATISFSDSAAVITLTPHTSRNILRYNTSGLFACYSSGQSPVYLYKEVSNNPSLAMASSYTAMAGQSFDLTAEASNYSPTSFVWSVENANPAGCATVSGSSLTGTVNPVASGTATIKLTASDGSGNSVSASCAVTINAAPTSVQVKVGGQVIDTDYVMEAFEGKYKTPTVSILPASADQSYTLSVQSETESGSFTINNKNINFVKKNQTGVIRVSSSLSSIYFDLNVKCNPDNYIADTFTYSGTPVEQKDGNAFNDSGITYTINKDSASSVSVPNSEVSYSPSVLTEETTSVTATHTLSGQTISIPVVVTGLEGTYEIKSKITSGSGYAQNVTPEILKANTDNSDAFEFSITGNLRLGCSPSTGDVGGISDISLATSGAGSLTLSISSGLVISRAEINVSGKSTTKVNVTLGSVTVNNIGNTARTKLIDYPFSESVTISSTGWTYIEYIKVVVTKATDVSKLGLAYGSAFNELTTDECSAMSGISSATWSKCNLIYSAAISKNAGLSSYLQEGASAQLGNALEQALYRYDMIVAKYGNTDFMSRNPSSGARVTPLSEFTSNASTWIIVAVSLAGLTAIGGYFFYKKRKENF